MQMQCQPRSFPGFRWSSCFFFLVEANNQHHPLAGGNWGTMQRNKALSRGITCAHLSKTHVTTRTVSPADWIDTRRRNRERAMGFGGICRTMELQLSHWSRQIKQCIFRLFCGYWYDMPGFSKKSNWFARLVGWSEGGGSLGTRCASSIVWAVDKALEFLVTCSSISMHRYISSVTRWGF